MRVLITTHYWWPHPGGIERVAKRQAELLVQRGHDVHVLTSAVGQPAAGRDSSGYAVTAVPAWNALEPAGVPWPLFSPEILRHARRLVAWSDVVLCHGQVYPATLAAMRWATATGTRVVLVQHNPEIAYRQALLRAAQGAADRSVGRWSLVRADTVVVPSTATAAYVRSLAPVPPRVVPWGIDADGFRPHPSDAARTVERRRLGIPDNATFVVAAGRLAAKNRFDVLVRACAEAAPRLPGLRCVLLGSGAEAGRLADLAKELNAPVRLAGRVDDEDLRAHLRSADLAVATAGRNEGFGLLVGEALASGAPVVVESEGGHVDLVAEGVNGWCFDGTPGGLASTIVSAAGDLARTGRRSWSDRARRSVAALTWDRHGDVLEQLLCAPAGPDSVADVVPMSRAVERRAAG